MVEKCDAALFGRIKRHVKEGRWSLYGGWWVQPDCNIPTKAGFERQISLGREFCKSRFGKFTEVARNVDSFGHSAALPQILHDAGQPNYMMMRPGPHEKTLPARIFRWRGFEDSPEVLVFRIPEPYCWNWADERAFIGHILNAASDLPEGVSDTMCLIGLGDHGGGPTIALINLCHKLMKDGIPGVKLEFSTPERFFKSLRKGDLSKVPEVTGELQYHAIGCYTLQRQLKVKGKRAESLLEALELSVVPKRGSDEAKKLKDAWSAVCFNQFHDIMGGTCLPSTYEIADAQVAAALTFAREQLSLNLRLEFPSLGSSKSQRLVLKNPSDEIYDGLIEAAPWGWGGNCIADGKGKTIPFQRIPADGMSRLLFKLKLNPFEMKALSLSNEEKPAQPESRWMKLSTSQAVNHLGFGLSLGAKSSVVAQDEEFDAPQLQLLEDPTDTWSHNFKRYLEGPAEIPQWGSSFLLHSGPVAAGLSRVGKLDGQEVREDFLLHADSAFYELSLRIAWVSKLKVLKLVLPFKVKAIKRIDGTASGQGLERALDGNELPVCDWMLFELEDGSKVGIVCPDILAADADERRLRLTLLRSPVMANHLPTQPAGENSFYSDHGLQCFRIGFNHSKSVSEKDMAAMALSWMRPPLTGDLTKGMPPA